MPFIQSKPGAGFLLSTSLLTEPRRPLLLTAPLLLVSLLLVLTTPGPTTVCSQLHSHGSF